MTKLITPKLCVSKQKLTKFEINQANSKLTLNSETKTIDMEVSGMNLEFQMKYGVTSDPNWLNDYGDATANIRDASIRMSLLPRASTDGVLQIDFKQMEIEMKDYRVKADGSSDLSKAIEIVFNSFKSFFKNELANMLAWRMAKSVEESMNTVMLSKAGIVSIP
jgi:hypothetical protein